MPKRGKRFDGARDPTYNCTHANRGVVVVTEAEWEALESEILECQRCPRLAAWRSEVAKERRRAYRDEKYWGKPVPGFGDQRARLLIVGLAPGAHGANRTGRLFTGDSSGQFLYSALYRAGIASRPDSHHRDDGMILRDAFLSAACRCAPPANKPSPGELLACRSFLAREVALLGGLRVIVALGRIAFDAVVQIDRSMRRSQLEPGPETPVISRGLVFKHAAVYPLSAAAPWLIASFHPSRQNTQTGRLTTTMFDEVWDRARGLLA
jgi:uracil-DNA glycosylase family 4